MLTMPKRLAMHIYAVEVDPKPGVDSSYHVWIDVSLRKGVMWGISIQSVHKGEVLFLFSEYFEKGYEEWWSEGRCTKVGPKLYRKNWQ